ncbi:hypothetical protein SLS61_004444 [Didymella pomorum]
MTIEFATWDSIHDWAQQEGFLAHFGKTSKFSLFSRPRITLKEGRVIDGHHIPGLEALKTMTINPQASVYAWIETDGSVKLRPLEWGDMAVHEGLTSPPTSFAQPFCWVLPIQNETGMRFESLVQYYTRLGFVNGPGIRTGIAALKEHFPGACHDMAKQIDAEAARRTISARAFPLSSQPEPIPQSPASLPSTSLKAFKATPKAFASQENQLFKEDAAAAEENTRAAEERATCAEAEAAKSEEQYEALMKMLEGALRRQA